MLFTCAAGFLQVVACAGNYYSIDSSLDKRSAASWSALSVISFGLIHQHECTREDMLKHLCYVGQPHLTGSRLNLSQQE